MFNYLKVTVILYMYRTIVLITAVRTYQVQVFSFSLFTTIQSRNRWRASDGQPPKQNLFILLYVDFYVKKTDGTDGGWVAINVGRFWI